MTSTLKMSVEPPVATAPAPEAVATQFLSRELSWLAFNQRVLEEAADPRWPLLERLNYFAIFHSNLDEFFMVRVSGLQGQVTQPVTGIEIGPDGVAPRVALDRIGQVVREQLRSAALLFERELLPALERAGIRLRSWASLDEKARDQARAYYREAGFPILTPLAVDLAHPFPFISNLSLSLAVEAEDPDTGERRFARVKVPEILPRFVPLERLDASPGEDADFLPLESLISANLETLFPGMQVLGAYPFRITRDMDLEILEAEADDLLTTVDREVRRRRFGDVVRLEVDPATPEHVRALLLEKLQLEAGGLYVQPAPLGASALSAISGLPRPALRNPPHVPVLPEALREKDIFATIRKGDVLLHHPYDSFEPVLHLLHRAAEDDDVLAIKMTLYRTGSNSEIVGSLVRAAENGKQVAVAIELKARFDEHNNIEWARKLERAGVHVFYSCAGLKIHAKAALVVRREEGHLRRYVHLSSGNYNPGTARLYTDVALLSASPELGEDVSLLFNALSGFLKTPGYRQLAVAPGTLVTSLLSRIDEQIGRAEQGKPAHIFAKMNALVDPGVIRALYRASQAGVRIDLCVRGICCLRPGMPGLSENIRVFSVVGRFLEHSRVFAFGPPGEDELFVSSADWMPRNLYRRVELLFPVRDPTLCERLRREVVEAAMNDNCRARDLDSNGVYRRRTPRRGEPERDAQLGVSLAVTQAQGRGVIPGLAASTDPAKTTLAGCRIEVGPRPTR